MTSLSHTDYERAFRYVHDLHESGAHMFEALVTGLGKLAPYDVVSVNYLEVEAGLVTSMDEPANTCDAIDALGIFRRVGHQHPVISHYMRTADPQAYRLSDLQRDSIFQRSDLYNEFYRALGLRHEISAFFPLGDGIGAVGLDRHSRDFSDRERELVSLLAPHLRQVCRRILPVLEQRSRGVPASLTARERDVAIRAAAGETNREIAVALGISARTVQKHLEHVYEKIGTRNRTATATVLTKAAYLPHRDAGRLAES